MPELRSIPSISAPPPILPRTDSRFLETSTRRADHGVADPGRHCNVDNINTPFGLCFHSLQSVTLHDRVLAAKSWLRSVPAVRTSAADTAVRSTPPLGKLTLHNRRRDTDHNPAVIITRVV